jgi:UDP-4-amino-4,6-dideoxy-N-acetyl-beta-L-altrosamine transaminase
MIPYGHQWINESDEAAVLAALQSEFLTQGPAVVRFEQVVAGHCEVPYAIAVSSGTSALHLACLALGVGPGDWVWTSPNTFVASANCARYCGANVDFVDIDPDTLNLSACRLAEKLNVARRENRLPKVVIPVHFAGRSCDMEAIAKLGREYGFRILEDASHALGATYRNSPVGACLFSGITTTSFHPVKIVTTGEGGMLMTRSAEIAERLTRLRSHGITRDPARMSGDSDGPWVYEQIELGFNYRMTDLQAALGESQMGRLSAFVDRRRFLAKRYRTRLSELPVRMPSADEDETSAWHLFVIRVEEQRRRQVFDSLRAAGIGVNVHYIPVHLQPYYRQLGFTAGQYPEAERYYREAITLPLYPAMGDDDQDIVIAALERALR